MCIRDRTLTESQADQRGMNPQNDKKVGQNPYNMPNRGYLMNEQKSSWDKLKEWAHGSK